MSRTLAMLAAVATSTMTVRPGAAWSKLSERPGRNAQTWTQDGDELNDITYHGDIAFGWPPFPRGLQEEHALAEGLGEDAGIPVRIQNSYRIVRDASSMAIDTIAPIQFAGSRSVRFTYTFSK